MNSYTALKKNQEHNHDVILAEAERVDLVVVRVKENEVDLVTVNVAVPATVSIVNQRNVKVRLEVIIAANTSRIMRTHKTITKLLKLRILMQKLLNRILQKIKQLVNRIIQKIRQLVNRILRKIRQQKLHQK